MFSPMARVRAGMQGIALLLLTLVLLGVSQPGSVRAADFLPQDEAFKPDITMRDAATIQVHYDIAPGYYMYREHFVFALTPPASATGDKAVVANVPHLGTPVFPKPDIKFDPTFNRDMPIYHHAVDITIPVVANGEFVLAVTGQGCAEKGVCYPPKTIYTKLSTDKIGQHGDGWLSSLLGSAQSGEKKLSSSELSPAASTALDVPGKAATVAPATAVGGLMSEQGGASVTGMLSHSSLLWIIGSMFLIGLGLSLTPCVYPMMPILSSIIVGQQGSSQPKRGRSFSLALVYVLGMAAVNTLLGIAAALLGKSLVAYLQNPWLLSVFALLLVVLALSMFGWYELSLPAAWQQRLDQATRQRKGGRLGSVFVMGALSALMVGPCVTPALAGTLGFIGQSGQVIVGALALFAMSLGMGVPLLAIGLAAGTVLPRAGAWMEDIRRVFGVVMLGAALWIVYPVLPPFWTMLCWMLLLLGSGAYMMWAVRPYWLFRAVALLLLMGAAAQGFGAFSGATDPARPLSAFEARGVLQTVGAGSNHADALNFVPVTSVGELEQALQTRPGISMLDFRADWCVDCRELERYTFPDKGVQQALVGMTLYQADVTKNTAHDQALMQRFGIYGPPALIFIGSDGKEIPGSRMVGFVEPKAFIAAVERIKATL